MQVAIEVVSILSDTELVGKCLNSKQLGERKNCNLPGVRVRLPVLTPHDVEDVQKFAAHNHMDFVAASFVQVRACVWGGGRRGRLLTGTSKL